MFSEAGDDTSDKYHTIIAHNDYNYVMFSEARDDTMSCSVTNTTQ